MSVRTLILQGKDAQRQPPWDPLMSCETLLSVTIQDAPVCMPVPNGALYMVIGSHISDAIFFTAILK